jgi:hypothetical protein
MQEKTGRHKHILSFLLQDDYRSSRKADTVKPL